jgi:hypothetical protein
MVTAMLAACAITDLFQIMIGQIRKRIVHDVRREELRQHQRF